jgi:hypothetical protein
MLFPSEKIPKGEKQKQNVTSDYAVVLGVPLLLYFCVFLFLTLLL